MDKPKEEHLFKLTKARLQLIMTQPFIADLVMGMPLRYCPDLHLYTGYKTMATDGRFIYWHPDFVEECDYRQLMFALAHEAFHVGFMHHLRMGNRDKEIWNSAGDYAINPVLIKSQLPPIKGILYKSEWDDKAAEWIYSELVKNAKKRPNKGQGGEPDDRESGDADGQNGEPGEGESGDELKGGKQKGWRGKIGEVVAPGEIEGEKFTEEQLRVEEQRCVQRFVQAVQSAKMAGNLPAGMEIILEELTKPRINWKAVLQRFLTETIRNDYNWSRPNKRYIAQGLYLPHLQSPSMGNGVVLMDTSGSMTKEDLIQLCSEIKAITDAYKVDLDIIYVDAKVAGVDKIDSWSPNFDVHPKGGGGTDFVPGFEYIEEKQLQPKFCLYLTDGCCNSFPEYAPHFPVIWVLTEPNSSFKPPFGQTLIMPREYENAA